MSARSPPKLAASQGSAAASSQRRPQRSGVQEHLPRPQRPQGDTAARALRSVPEPAARQPLGDRDQRSAIGDAHPYDRDRGGAGGVHQRARAVTDRGAQQQSLAEGARGERRVESLRGVACQRGPDTGERDPAAPHLRIELRQVEVQDRHTLASHQCGQVGIGVDVDGERGQLDRRGALGQPDAARVRARARRTTSRRACRRVIGKLSPPPAALAGSTGAACDAERGERRRGAGVQRQRRRAARQLDLRGSGPDRHPADRQTRARTGSSGKQR